MYACDLATGEWTLSKVLDRQSFDYRGDMVDIQIGKDSIQSTGNQPFYVLRGEKLSERPIPGELTKEERAVSGDGRWVEARDLQKGDVLQSRRGKGLVITGLSSRQERKTVYWLDVERYFNCAVHRLGILAHNGGGSSAKTGRPEPPMLFQADHPFLFMIRENLTGSILFMGRVSNPQ